MRTALTVLILMWATATYAQPPAIGEVHDFIDEHFNGAAFHAWSVGVTGRTGVLDYALYLELFKEVNT